MNITITTVGISRCCAELIALRNVVVDGRECTVTLTRDNGITEYVAWEPLEGHSQMTKILSTELGAITSRPLPTGCRRDRRRHRSPTRATWRSRRSTTSAATRAIV